MRTTFSGSVGGALVLIVSVAALPLQAQMDMQHQMSMGTGPLGIPESRTGSGTSWLPDASPMHAAHKMVGNWTLMLHGVGVLQYDWQGSSRGSNQVGFVNWAMAMATRPVGNGQLQLRSMLSAEPWTIGSRGYPLLLQSGESYKGAPLHDRQHPHDLFMELAALYDPLAPISHHWQDGTHITFGVLTAGVFTKTVKLEASWFNGREPDEKRTTFDYSGRRLDSYSGRVTVNPGPHASLSAWYAYLKSPEELRLDESLHRIGAALLTSKPTGKNGTWSNALIYGANDMIGTGGLQTSVVLESTLEPDRMNSFFGRAEYVRKSAEELVITGVPPTTEYAIVDFALGYARTIGLVDGLQLAVGARASVNFVPASLESAYGSRTPSGLTMYLRVRPKN